jgi:anti-sigma factor RsiW
MVFSRTDCARARESVSAELDGELPELELEWQRAHLRVCPACSAWAERVQETTRWLREAPLEEPIEAAWTSLPRRRRAWRVSPAVAVTSAAALAASVVVGLGPQNRSLSSPRTGPELSRSLSSHPLKGAKLFTGHPVGLQNLLGVDSSALGVQRRPAAPSSSREAF